MSADFPPEFASKLSRREILAGLAMLSAGGLAAARRPNIELNYLGNKKLDQVIPEQIGRWKFVGTSGLVVPPKDQLALALYSQLLTRVYDDGHTPIMLLLAYSATQNGFLQVHRPEFCYTASGFGLADFAQREIKVTADRAIKVNTMSAVRDDRGESLLYWVRIGEHIPLSWAQQKLVFAEDNLRMIVPDSLLVRISTPLVDPKADMAAIGEFVATLVESTSPQFRRVLIG
jgi:EpsI family protein